jgi:two-component system NtrC family sensor kinase
VEESQRALIQAEKMAAVGRLMASLAHEINNPLQSVRNCLHLVGHKGLHTEQREYYLNLTDTELERLVLTVRRMLDFYRPGGADKEKADMHSVIEQVLGILSPQLNEQKIRVKVQYSGENRLVEMVPNQIQQVIFNLVLNAMDALEEVDAQEGQDDQPGRLKEVWIDVIHETDQVRVTVEDSGPGVPPELHERIFEPFVSTKQHGTGLGLAVCYGIMERHQGTLSLVAPRYALGACFEMIIPFGADV